MYFASDNGSPAHPNVMDAVLKANSGYSSSYGTDALMDGVTDRIREAFEAPEAAVYLVATGTTANALSLATFCPPWGSVFCHQNAHVEVDECGAPEFYTGGAKLVLVDGDHAKMRPASLNKKLQTIDSTDVHVVQKGVLSITNVTEFGGVYSPSEVAELTGIAKSHGMPCHMDGARFANALVSSNASPAEMTWKSGIDVLSFGGTKNGCMGVEAVVIFDPAKAWEFELRRKRGGHLFSKHRYLSAQMQAYLEDDLWLALARHSNAMAQRLSQGIVNLDTGALIHPTDANMVFASYPRHLHQKASATGAVAPLWPFGQAIDGPRDEILSTRLVCSWCTQEADVDGLLDLLRAG